MRIKFLLLALLVVSTLLSAGCSLTADRGTIDEVFVGQNNEGGVNEDKKLSLPAKVIIAEEEGFSLKKEDKARTFHIAYGWTGGMGSMPILTEPNGGVKQQDGLAIYFDPSYVKEVGAKLPSCFEGKPDIKVTAKAHLEKKSGINESITPNENNSQPVENYYILKVDAFAGSGIEVKAMACLN